MTVATVTLMASATLATMLSAIDGLGRGDHLPRTSGVSTLYDVLHLYNAHEIARAKNTRPKVCVITRGDWLRG